jgi:hypothetical protein
MAWDPVRKRDEALLAGLAVRFAQSNLRLQRLSCYSLAEWGYPLPAVAAGEAGTIADRSSNPIGPAVNRGDGPSARGKTLHDQRRSANSIRRSGISHIPATAT